MSVFDLTEQNSNFDKKIVAGLERLSLAFRSMLWKKAMEQHLSPIQIQLLIFIRYHSEDKNNISYLAEEFGLTKATVSEAMKVLGQKQLVKKNSDRPDRRRFSISLTRNGMQVVHETEHYTSHFAGWIKQMTVKEKECLWKSVAGLVEAVGMNARRACYTCGHFGKKKSGHFCGLLNKKLSVHDIRIDCPDHETA